MQRNLQSGSECVTVSRPLRSDASEDTTNTVRHEVSKRNIGSVPRFENGGNVRHLTSYDGVWAGQSEIGSF